MNQRRLLLAGHAGHSAPVAEHADQAAVADNAPLPQTITDLAIARTESQAGAVAFYSVLNAEQMYEAAQLAPVEAEMMRLTDTAALFQALGGGWWHRNDPAVAPMSVANN